MKNTIDIHSYIKTFPKEKQILLNQFHKEIKLAAPKSVETIKYGIPTMEFYGTLVHFGCFAKHIGFFPGPSAIKHFAKELVNYKTSKGTIKFSFSEPIPYALVRKIVKFRLKENIFKTLNS
jgi:uncharacterized protein YdhG (YjbR/CyaY superfamily)